MNESLPPILGEPDRQEIHEIHRNILQRERQEPKEGLEPTPWWVWAVSVIVIFAMGCYLGRYGGNFAVDAETSPAKAEAVTPPQGDVVYSTICMPCHQAGGTGMEGRYPPLAGSEWLAKDASVPARIVLNGLEGRIQVKGKLFENQMPALGEQLSDAEIAAVLTYVRSSFGNKAPPVAMELIKTTRQAIAGQGPWTAERLK